MFNAFITYGKRIMSGRFATLSFIARACELVDTLFISKVKR